MLDHFFAAIGSLLSPMPILMIIIGTGVGIIVGSIPGLSATMAMAVFSPITFFMPPIQGIPFLIGLYKGGIYGGSISAVLINTPGTASSAATVMDGYPLAQKGKGIYALTASLNASIIGDLVGTTTLVLIAPPLATIALKFGPIEIFSLILFSLTFVCIGQRGSLLKAWLATSFGILLSVIGQDPLTGYPRFTFGNYDLQVGVELVPLAIGLFGFSEVLAQAEVKIGPAIERVSGLFSLRTYKKNMFTFIEAARHIPLIIQSSIIGVIIGILPGIGSETSCWVSYTFGMKRAKNQDEWGKGAIEGVIAAETANSCECGTAMVPLLTFGIPGDVVTAVMLGAFIAQGLRPGPQLFAQNPEVMLGIFIAMYLATIAMYVLGHGIIIISAQILNIKKSILFPCIAILCFVGTFAIRNNPTDLITMTALGFIGYMGRKFCFPIAPIVLGFILGGMLEVEFRRGVIMGAGDALIFFKQPISAVFLLITFLALILFIWDQFKGKQKWLTG